MIDISKALFAIVFMKGKPDRLAKIFEEKRVVPKSLN
jgi:hypothetical protein